VISRALLAVLFCAFSAHANVVGVDIQNFNPTNDGLDFVTVHSSKTLRPGLINIGLFMNYAVNVLPNYEDSSTQSRTNFKDSLLSSDINFGLGITRNWEVGMSFPSILAQNIDSDLTTLRGEFTSTGVTESRLMTKLRFFGGQDAGLAGVFTVNLLQVQNDPFVGTGAGPTYNFELAADTLLGGGFAWAVNAGYRLRDPGTPIPGVPIQPMGNHYIASTALSYLISSWDTKLIGEVFSSYPAEKQNMISDRKSSTAEALLGIKVDISRSLAFHFGGGTELIHGTASPDWRAYTGINWVIGPVFHKPKREMVRVVSRARVKRAQKVIQVQQVTDLMGTEDPFAGVPQPKEEFMMSDILFEFDKDTINPEFMDLLRRFVKYLQKPPAFKSMIIEGHTDSIGSDEYNADLSRRRAERVQSTLMQLGLNGTYVTAIGYGAKRPIASNGNYQGRALNRRVEFKVQR
jgi:outer membrane protein OmpA-like peptidoglycan-associated protein